jgi:uncharacterized flavoprotein (TIGR03862 family)
MPTSPETQRSIAVIGGGPAGLRAAEVAAEGGALVTVYDAMRSVGRKFLVAGKSGLNLTNAEALDAFHSRYHGGGFPTELWHRILYQFDNRALREWALGLGIETFEANSGKVFPTAVDGTIRAAPLLRRWIERLRRLGVVVKTRHRWTGWNDEGALTFDSAGQSMARSHDAVILALGGASWPQTGSTGEWTRLLKTAGVDVTALTAANCGWEVDWPPELLSEAEGLPMKNLAAIDGNDLHRGELRITRYGLEGPPLYRLGPALRSMPTPEIVIDFKPNQSIDELVRRLGKVKRNFVREARRRWNIDPATAALLKYLPNRGPWKNADQLAHELKRCRIPLTRPRPVAEAISSAGGIAWSELDDHLMIKRLPGVFVAGEMIDWEAPTGGYLLQGCFATGDWAGRAAIEYLG